MSLDVSSLAPVLQMGTSITALGMVCYLSYNMCTGVYRKENYINVIKYCLAFGMGYFILKGLIGAKHTVSFTSSKISNYANITVVGVWAFNFNSIASIAKTVSTLISTSAAGAATAIIAIVFSIISLHTRLAMNAWRGPMEVIEAFVYGIIAYFCMAYFDVFYDSMTLFLDSTLSSLFDYNIYERYSQSLNPIMQANKDLIKNLDSFSILGAFTNVITMALSSLTMILLFLMDLVNLMLYSVQYFGLMLLPTFTIAITFFSGIDPTKPLKLCGAFACMSLLAKTQIIIMNLLFSSFSSVEINSFNHAFSNLDLGIAVAGDNLALIVKVALALACSLILIGLMSTKVLGKVFSIVASNQMMPMVGHIQAIVSKIRN